MGGVFKDKWDDYICDVYRIINPGTGWAQCGESSLPKWDDDSVPADSNYAKVFFDNFKLILVSPTRG